MKNKIAYVSGITAVVTALFLSGAASMVGLVKADDGGWGSYGPGGWHCDWQWDSGGHKVCESYTQHPIIQQVSFCGWNPNSPQCNSVTQQPTVKQVECQSCENGCGCYGSSAIQQPTITNVNWHCNWQYDSNGYRECISTTQQSTTSNV